MCRLVALCVLTARAVWTASSAETQPLVFEFMRDDPQQVKIFWDPIVNVGRVLQLANREIAFTRDADGQLREEYGKWNVLVTDVDLDDGTKRYVFLKHDLCNEVDWQISWHTTDGIMHGPTIQRMPPSPVPWAPEAIILPQPPRYDPLSDMVSVAVQHDILGDLGFDTLTMVKPSIDLHECLFLFKTPQPRPTVTKDSTLLIPAEYARSECKFSIRLSTLTYNAELQCRDLQQTVDEQSKMLELWCGDMDNMECPDLSGSTDSCQLDCNPSVQVEARVDDEADPPTPYVRLSWLSNVQDRRNYGYVVRHAEIDRVHSNLAVKEFNATVLDVPAGRDANELRLARFSNDADASYGLQVCVRWQPCEPADIDWMRVPQRRIRFNDYIEEIEDALYDKDGDLPVADDPHAHAEPAAEGEPVADAEKKPVAEPTAFDDYGRPVKKVEAAVPESEPINAAANLRFSTVALLCLLVCVCRTC